MVARVPIGGWLRYVGRHGGGGSGGTCPGAVAVAIAVSVVAFASPVAAQADGGFVDAADLSPIFASSAPTLDQVTEVDLATEEPSICNQPVPDLAQAIRAVAREIKNSDGGAEQTVYTFSSSANAGRAFQTLTNVLEHCTEPYTSGDSTITPGGSVAVGSDALAYRSTRRSGSLTANRATIFVVDTKNLGEVFVNTKASFAATDVKKMAKAFTRRVRALKGNAPPSPGATTPASGRPSSCSLLSAEDLTAAFGVAFGPPTGDCSYPLAEGAGSIDLSTTFPGGSTTPGDAYTEATASDATKVQIAGAKRAAYVERTNDLGQTSESVVVLTKNGDLFEIRTLGDDTPNGVKTILTKLAAQAVKSLNRSAS